MRTCPCCGYQTLQDPHPGSYEVCPICYWEDDQIQLADPDYEGGANKVSLRQAQRNFAEFGACEEGMRQHVRPLSHCDVRDPLWKPLDEREQ